MTCGCNQPNNQHGDARHLTLSEIRVAARAAGITPDQAIQNIVATYQDGSGVTKNFDISTPVDASGGNQGLAPYDLAGTRRRKRKRNKGGSAQTLRDYWTHHGHGGPTEFAGADAIAWGTPGDFNRCVAQVSKHMTEEQAKGYCNLRHKEALGVYPSQHKADPYHRGPDETVQCPACKKYNAPDALYCDQCGAKLPESVINKDQPRVPAGSTGGGEFGAGGQASGGSPPVAGGTGGPPTSGGGGGKGSGSKKAIRQHIAQLRQQIAAAETSLKALQASQSHLGTHAGATRTPRGTSTKPGGTSGATGGKTGSSGAGKPPTTGGKPSAPVKSVAQQIQDTKTRIAKLRGEITQLQTQLASAKALRNVREEGTGRFRTFQGELAEARTALAGGRINDVMELLGSARALARTDQERTQLTQLQESLHRTRNETVVPDLVKAGPHGYSHGWIKAGAPTPKTADQIKAGDVFTRPGIQGTNWKATTDAKPSLYQSDIHDISSDHLSATGDRIGSVRHSIGSNEVLSVVGHASTTADFKPGDRIHVTGQHPASKRGTNGMGTVTHSSHPSYPSHVGVRMDGGNKVEALGPGILAKVPGGF
jgi:hypothetical protein